ncbi:hypothetical protein [uncultured Tenacibaculum sp.]|uniref:hypothetical protein n=1 Tax=uncultured Tenacibaculum sp. TaxID=174713 RepID=UPI002631EB3B|nr:hypothetical protein [uncultured Tenacibaculum sp.]
MLKEKLSYIKLFLCCLGTVLFFANCNEEEIELEKKQNLNYEIEDINFNSFIRKQELKEFYNKVISEGETLKRSEERIGINTTLIRRIKTDKIESYTFAVDKDHLQRNEYENLVITKDLQEDKITAAFLKYKMATELEVDQNGEPYPFQGALEIIPVEEQIIEGLLSRSTTVCFRVGVLMCNDNRGDYTSDHQVTEACTRPENIYTAQSIECATTFGPPSFTNETGGGIIAVDSGSSGGSGSPSNSGGTIITSPLPSDLKTEFFELVDRLTPEQHEFLYELENSSIRKEIGVFYERDNFSLKAEEFIKEAINVLMDNGDVNFDDWYIKTKVSDDNYFYDGPKESIPDTLILSDGSSININFGTTRSDNKNADQEVSPVLVEGMKFALEKANNNLSSSEKITSIYISATTNGEHSATSNHPLGLAIDISRINGKRMAVTGVTNQIKELQKAFDSFQYIRENFGPHFKHKYDLNTNRWNFNYPVGGHKDHIHISVRK